MSRTVMVIDDDAVLRKEMSIALTLDGYDVIEAGNGREAIERLDGRRIHLVISGLDMQAPDGTAFVKEIRRRLDYRFTPILMLTAGAHEDRMRAGQTAGTHAWVVKPFRTRQLRDAVAQLVLP